MTSVKTYLLINFKTRKPQTWRVALVKWPPSRLSNRSGKYVIECKETLFLVGYISHWYLALSEERYCCSWNSCRQVCSRIGKQFPRKSLDHIHSFYRNELFKEVIFVNCEFNAEYTWSWSKSYLFKIICDIFPTSIDKLALSFEVCSADRRNLKLTKQTNSALNCMDLF